MTMTTTDEAQELAPATVAGPRALVLDGAGRIVSTTAGWRDAHALRLLGAGSAPGESYVVACARSIATGRAGAVEAVRCLREALGNARAPAEVLYDAAAPMLMRITALSGDEETTYLVTHEYAAASAEDLTAFARCVRAAAHDLNNVLSVLVGFAELGRRSPVVREPFGRYFREIADAVGRGTAIADRLRAAARRREGVACGSARPSPERAAPMVLVVDHDVDALQASAAALREGGCRVLLASGVNEAVRHWERHGSEIALLVTDVTLPDMDGRDLAGWITATHPRLRVLFLASGDSAPAGIDPLFLSKPVAAAALVRRVREVLGDA